MFHHHRDNRITARILSNQLEMPVTRHLWELMYI